MERCCWYPFLILPVTTIIYSSQLLIYLSTWSWYTNSWGDFVVHFPSQSFNFIILTFINRTKMICFEVKMTVYDKQYTFTHTHPQLHPKRHTHPNPPKPEKYKLPDYLNLFLRVKFLQNPLISPSCKRSNRSFLANFSYPSFECWILKSSSGSLRNWRRLGNWGVSTMVRPHWKLNWSISKDDELRKLEIDF